MVDIDNSYNEGQEGTMACEPIRSSWGGTWTEEKLDALEKYVNAYLTIMNVQRSKFGWKLIYFDGFAGSGSRNDVGSHTISDLMLDLFNDKFINEEELDTYKGAAEREDEEFLKDYFYKKRTENTLFGETEIIEKVKKPIEKIAELYIEQLKSIFKHVTEKPLVLYNTRNTPIFHFACASNNETAIKIASQIISKKQGL